MAFHCKARGMTALRFFLYLITGLCLLSYRLAEAQDAPAATLSIDAGQKANEDFLNTLFYTDDRGLHQYPNAIDLFEETFGGRAWNETPQQHASYSRHRLEKHIEKKVISGIGVQQTKDGRFIGVYREEGPHYSIGVGGCVL